MNTVVFDSEDLSLYIVNERQSNRTSWNYYNGRNKSDAIVFDCSNMSIPPDTIVFEFECAWFSHVWDHLQKIYPEYFI